MSADVVTMIALGEISQVPHGTPGFRYFNLLLRVSDLELTLSLQKRPPVPRQVLILGTPPSGGRGSYQAATASGRVPWLAAQQELRPPGRA